jgi:hypothetical protein
MIFDLFTLGTCGALASHLDIASNYAGKNTSNARRFDSLYHSFFEFSFENYR